MKWTVVSPNLTIGTREAARLTLSIMDRDDLTPEQKACLILVAIEAEAAHKATLTDKQGEMGK